MTTETDTWQMDEMLDEHVDRMLTGEVAINDRILFKLPPGAQWAEFTDGVGETVRVDLNRDGVGVWETTRLVHERALARLLAAHLQK